MNSICTLTFLLLLTSASYAFFFRLPPQVKTNTNSSGNIKVEPISVITASEPSPPELKFVSESVSETLKEQKTTITPVHERKIEANLAVTNEEQENFAVDQTHVLYENQSNDRNETPITENPLMENMQPPIVESKSDIKDDNDGRNHMPNKNFIESGALYRSFYVFCGLSVLALAYFIYRNYRSGQISSNIVQKYGIRTNRNDMEMAPLPINDDDDEDTLFESNRNKQESHYYDYNNITTYEIK